MRLSRKAVEHIALAARIEVIGEEEKIENYLEHVLSSLEQLVDMKLYEVTPTGRIAPQANVVRKDEVCEIFPDDKNLSSAPVLRDSYFRVPRII